MEKVLYTVKEVSQILHTNPSYVYQLINTGLLPVLKLGSYKVRHEALMKFLSEYEGYDLSDPKNVEKITATAV
jgi:excisionase family DNA binding protein